MRFLVMASLIAAISMTACRQETSSMQGEDNSFRVEDTESITELFLADKTGRSIDIVKQGKNDWLLNGKYKAREGAVTTLLETFKKMRVKYSANKEAENNILRNFATGGIKVMLYTGNKNLLKTFYVGEPTPDTKGTYLMMEGSQKPYAVHLGNWEGDIRTRFMLNEVDWRDRTLFDYEREDIEAVSIEYLGQRDQSFKLSKSDGDWKVQPFYASTTAINKPLAGGTVLSFLEGFKRVIGEDFINSPKLQDSVTHTAPFATIEVKTTEDKVRKIKFYPLPGRVLDKVDVSENQQRVTRGVTEHYHAWIDDKDFLLCQDLIVKRLFWGYNSFFLAPPAKGKAPAKIWKPSAAATKYH
jgi:hypothetical protein